MTQSPTRAPPGTRPTSENEVHLEFVLVCPQGDSEGSITVDGPTDDGELLLSNVTATFSQIQVRQFVFLLMKASM